MPKESASKRRLDSSKNTNRRYMAARKQVCGCASLADFGQGIGELTCSWIVKPMIGVSSRLFTRNWPFHDQMSIVNRSYSQVRNELAEIGLLYTPTNENDGGYLDQIELEVAWLPSLGEAGYVYEALPWVAALVGYREGVIYLPSDLPRCAYVPGGTLTDVIRHEYAHAWHWLEPDFFERPWFANAFGAGYEECSYRPLDLWSHKNSTRAFEAKVAACRNYRELNALLLRTFRNDFVSGYAATLFCEDFAETFMTYLRYRTCLDKFKARTGLFRKLKAVEKAVSIARRELGV